MNDTARRLTETIVVRQCCAWESCGGCMIALELQIFMPQLRGSPARSLLKAGGQHMRFLSAQCRHASDNCGVQHDIYAVYIDVSC